jgi:hypothetical protein
LFGFSKKFPNGVSKKGNIKCSRPTGWPVRTILVIRELDSPCDYNFDMEGVPNNDCSLTVNDDDCLGSSSPAVFFRKFLLLSKKIKERAAILHKKIKEIKCIIFSSFQFWKPGLRVQQHSFQTKTKNNVQIMIESL